MVTCDSVQQMAQDLFEQNAACGVNDTCVVYDLFAQLPNTCLSAFQCHFALNSNAAFDAYVSEALAIDAMFPDNCPCMLPACFQPSGASCNGMTMLCEVEP